MGHTFIGVKKILQICKPTRKAKAIMAGVKDPVLLYTGAVAYRYTYAIRVQSMATKTDAIDNTGST